MTRPSYPSITEIQRHTADYFGTKLIDMISQRRMRRIARPRQVAMYLSRKLTRQSLPQIARAFRKEDHTTVLHAVRRIEELQVGDAKIRRAVFDLTALLRPSDAA